MTSTVVMVATVTLGQRWIAGQPAQTRAAFVSRARS
jgi:hypothetical protein